jgi:L-fuconolactonase
MAIDRRTFLLSATLAAQAKPIPIIDAHIHLFDPARPQGVPWPAKDDPVLYKRALPDRYRKIALPFGVVGAIEVECSPWIEDNQWVLDIAAKDSIVVGTIGNLEPGKPEFRSELDRFHKNPLFRGIRYGNLWGRDLGVEIAKPEFVAGLKALADAGLVLDTTGSDAALIGEVIRVTDKVPGLRVVIDHLPQIHPLPDLTELAKRPQVYVKVTEVLRRENGKVPANLDFYRDALERIWSAFGEDRLLYGSDWPNSDLWAPFEVELNVVREFFRSKGRAAEEKYFWKNSVAAYKWVKRESRQPKMLAFALP